jgi:tripartite-type tricarboxylate transporter receptor subunit TctC
MPTRRAVLGLAATLSCPGLGRAQPGDYPDRSLRYIVPFTPAGLTDIMARLIAQKLSDLWGKPVVVDNRPGGNALIGADAAAKAPADGYTLLAITLTHAVNVGLFPQAPYNLLRDFRPVSVLGSLPLVVVVNPNSPAKSLGELLEMAKTGQMNGGSSGNGSPPHLGLELLRRVSGAKSNLVHVPYRGGAPGVTDLVAGNLDVMVSNLPECIGQIRAGRLRPLGLTGAERSTQVPEIPTVRELGFPGLEITNWTAMLTHAGVPEGIFARLEHDTLAAIRDPEVKRRAVDGGFDVLGWDADRSRAFVEAEVARWSRLVQEAGIKAD